MHRSTSIAAISRKNATPSARHDCGVWAADIGRFIEAKRNCCSTLENFVALTQEKATPLRGAFFYQSNQSKADFSRLAVSSITDFFAVLSKSHQP